MNVADFDQWRQDYDTMSCRDQMAFYDRVAVDHPLQRGFDVEAFKMLFEAVTLPAVQVLEFGGWKGELAAGILPKFDRIVRWVNLEISPKAVLDTQCRDTRYEAMVGSVFVWEIHQLPFCNVFVSSHAIEHIRAAQLKQLFGNLPGEVSFIGLQAPLAEGATDWSGYYGSHILEVGWVEVGLMLQRLGFTQFMEKGEFRGYKR